MNYQAIRDLVAADQALGALAAAEDWEGVAAALNARDQVKRDGVTRDVLQNALMQVPYEGDLLWYRLREIQKTPADPRWQIADRVVYTVQESLLQGISFVNPGIVAMMDTMQAAGMLTAEQKAAINALGDRQVSRAELAGLPRLSGLDVFNAMTEEI